jgi:hypothetical protein
VEPESEVRWDGRSEGAVRKVFGKSGYDAQCRISVEMCLLSPPSHRSPALTAALHMKVLSLGSLAVLKWWVRGKYWEKA